MALHLFIKNGVRRDIVGSRPSRCVSLEKKKREKNLSKKKTKKNIMSFCVSEIPYSLLLKFD